MIASASDGVINLFVIEEIVSRSEIDDFLYASCRVTIIEHISNDLKKNRPSPFSYMTQGKKTQVLDDNGREYSKMQGDLNFNFNQRETRLTFTRRLRSVEWALLTWSRPHISNISGKETIGNLEIKKQYVTEIICLHLKSQKGCSFTTHLTTKHVWFAYRYIKNVQNLMQ